MDVNLDVNLNVSLIKNERAIKNDCNIKKQLKAVANYKKMKYTYDKEKGTCKN